MAVPMLELGCIYNGTSAVTVNRMSQRSVALKTNCSNSYVNEHENRHIKLHLTAQKGLKTHMQMQNKTNSNW